MKNLSKMDKCLDDDFIPPTPQILKKQSVLFRNSKTSKDPHNSKSKIAKTSSKCSKRKKESGASPDLKKFKDKAKQVSLLGYLKKENLQAVKQLPSTTNYLPSSTVKVNLFGKKNNIISPIKSTNCAEKNTFLNNDKIIGKASDLYPPDDKTDKNNDILCSETAEIMHLEVSVIESEVNIKIEHKLVKDLETCNSNILNLNCGNNATPKLSNTDNSKNSSDSFNLKNQIMKDEEESRMICKEIKNLSLELSDKTQIGGEFSKLVLDTNDQNFSQKAIIKDKDESYTCDHSLSWLGDIDWKNNDTFGECETILMDDTLPFEDVKENKTIIPYAVTAIQRTLPDEIKLILKSNTSKDQTQKICILRGFWRESFINVGDIVHVLKDFKGNETIIDNSSGFLVINPDFLLSSTAVVSTLFCMRKACLNHILPHWSIGNNVMRIGILVHDAFQQAVNSSARSNEDIYNILKKVWEKRENLIALSCQETPENEIKEKVLEYVPSINSWIQKYSAVSGQCSSTDLQVTSVQAIEDNLWCPKYGIKGKIDMTVQTYLPKHRTSKIMPLELKTGRPSYSSEHIGQINLYSLMMEERFNEISDGLLLYLKDVFNMKTVAANHNSLRGLIQLRNELTHYTHKWASNAKTEDIEDCHLPDPIDNKRLCTKCPYVLPCTVYQRALSQDKSLKPGHAMVSLIQSSTSHLTSSHLQYFIHWSNLLLLESTSSAVSNTFWREDAFEREKKGMCLSCLQLDAESKKAEGLDNTFYILGFRRSLTSVSPSSLDSVGVKEGDYIAVSKQGCLDEVALVMGYIVNVSEKSVEIIVEKDLTTVPNYKDCVFRIDKQVSNSANSCIRNNLMLLMENCHQASRIRDFIIDRQEPNFLKSLPKSIVLQGRTILKPLNKVQQKVVLKALMAEDYFIIKGMPGTGKTSTIVALVRLLMTMGVSVFLTSYTHSAIDNILLKLKEYVKFVRIGQEARMHRDLKQFSFESLTRNCTTVDDFKTFMSEQTVVAATCLSMNHAIFKVRKFDVCIVDEASQINQIACIGPLFFAKKFILVGDDKQLPPLVINEKARNKGMQESLLQRLSNKNNSLDLTIQYRMNKEIMRFCNTLTYDGVLQCGSEKIAESVLEINSCSLSSGSDWLNCAFESNLEKSVIFFNTEEAVTIANSETGQGHEINEFEAKIVTDILKFLSLHKVPETQIGIIAPYRKQVDLLKNKIKSLNLNSIEVNTVDQYQGRDKDVIIISCVKSKRADSNPDQKAVILNDERRLNVAITRAKRKLILIGYKPNLLQFTSFEKLLKLMRCSQIINIPKELFL